MARYRDHRGWKMVVLSPSTSVTGLRYHNASEKATSEPNGFGSRVFDISSLRDDFWVSHAWQVNVKMWVANLTSHWTIKTINKHQLSAKPMANGSCSGKFLGSLNSHPKTSAWEIPMICPGSSHVLGNPQIPYVQWLLSMDVWHISWLNHHRVHA